MNNQELNSDDDLNQSAEEKQLNFQKQSNFQSDHIAQMAGNTEQDEHRFAPVPDDAEQIEPSQVITQPDFWRFILKLFMVAVPILLVVSTIAFTGQFISSIFTSNKNKPKSVAQKTQTMQTSKEEDIAKLKTDSAISAQVAEIKSLNEALNRSKPTPAVKPSVAPIIKPTFTAATRTTIKAQPVPVGKVANKTNRTSLVSKYEPAANIKAAQPEKQIIPIFIPISSAPTVPTQPEFTRSSTNQVMTAKPQSQFIETTQTVSAANNDSSTINQNKSSNKTKKNKPKIQVIASPSLSNGLTAIVGSRALAKLELPIVWIKNSTNSDNSPFSNKDKSNKIIQTYPIKLIEPLKNPDGAIVLPKDTLLITQIKSVTAQGWVNLSVVSIITPTTSGSIEKPVLFGAISVLKKDGSPLKAGVNTVTQLLNINDTNATNSVSKIRNFPVRHGIDPIHNESARRKNEELQSNAKIIPPVSQIRSYTLEKGAKVQIYVNRSISL